MNIKVKRAVRLFLSTPIAFVFVFLSRVISPFFIVRIGALRSDRIGHFVLETELQLLEIENGVAKQPQRSFNIWYAPEPIANRVVYKMWKRVMRIWPNWFMVPVFRLNEILPGSTRHRIAGTTSTCLDVHNLLDSQRQHLFFTPRETDLGNQALREMGINEHDRFICLIARDAAYTKSQFPERDLSYHDYRNCDIDDYLPAAEAIADRGVFVLRMGSVVEKQLKSSHSKVIDYANSNFRTEFMDVFLGSRCEFCVSDGLGFYAIPAAFRRPNAYVNYSPFYMFYSSRSCDLGIAKTVGSVATGERLNLSQMGEAGVTQFSSSLQYSQAGVSIINNSPGEIRDLMIEMLDRIEGKWTTESGDKELQERFWIKYSEVIGEKRFHCHGEIRSKYGAQFLRDNPDWIL